MSDIPITKNIDVLIISAKLESGKFEAELKIPLNMEPEEKSHVFGAWLNSVEEFLSYKDPIKKLDEKLPE
jgi:hypothetical protein